MKKCKSFINIKTVSLVLLLLLGIIVELVLCYKQEKLTEQNVAKKWEFGVPSSQISCFFSTRAYLSQEDVLSFEHTLDTALKEASIENPSQNPGARLWIDTYSAEGSLTANYEKNSVNLTAYGVGGDYFFFHPLTLISGAYFQSSDINHDYCVLDKDAAWRLFGSTDVVGMIIDINDRPFLVSGVVENPKEKIYEKAGMDRGVIYVSFENLVSKDSVPLINHYEIVMPNPVKGYALNYVKENIGVNEKEVEVLENTTRFSKLTLLQHLKKLSTRAMNSKAVIYPYWENVARVKEDQMAKLLLFQVICYLGAMMIFVAIVVKWWGRRKFTSAVLIRILRDKYYDFTVKLYSRFHKRGGKV